MWDREQRATRTGRPQKVLSVKGTRPPCWDGARPARVETPHWGLGWRFPLSLVNEVVGRRPRRKAKSTWKSEWPSAANGGEGLRRQREMAA